MSLQLPGTDMFKQELGYNRKVKLKPGKGLMDWIRQSNASRLSKYPIMASVDEYELSRHNKLTDCWILLFDNVYDVTHYLEFHPGGVDEIMRAAGTDATGLFNEIHMWVNYRSMLKSCLIGPFIGNKLNSLMNVWRILLPKIYKQRINILTSGNSPSTASTVFFAFASNFSGHISANNKKDDGTSSQKKATRDSLYYGISLGVIAVGFTFAAIPAYRIFCETTSFGGTTQVAKDFDKIEKMEKVKDRLIQVQFNADVPSSMQWHFKPLQNEIYVHPGETALAFFTAKNPTNKPIVGISSYNLTPFQAAYYFNKIQCFCFEEQILNPGEEVDLPVFFYIDPDFANDPLLEFMDQVLLSYTFFESKPDLSLPSPFDPKNRHINKILESK